MVEIPQDTMPTVGHGEYRSEASHLEASCTQTDSVSDDRVKEKLIEILEKSDLSVTTGTFDSISI